jgi:CO/xanthine dehydrogenase Mo-binding subunit
MRYIGTPQRRTEDPRLVRGEGQYVGDLRFPGMLHAGFVRSSHAHARVRSIDVEAARALPGIVAVFTAAELPALGKPVPGHAFPPGLRTRSFSPLARDIVRYVGEPVAAVLAEDEHALADALDLVAVDYKPREVVSDVETAVAGGPLVWADIPNNIALDQTTGFGDVDRAFAEADVVIEERFAIGRAAPAAIETRATAAVPGGEPRLTVCASSQAPHILRAALAEHLGLDTSDVRVIVPDVGGGFGPKGRQYPEDYAIAAIAFHLGRPVRFVLTRREDLLTTWHGRGQVHHARLAARADGTILALDDRFLQDAGAYIPNGLAATGNTTTHVIGPYRVPALRVRVTGVYTNRIMTSPLRGGGRPEGIYVMERLLDRLAQRLGLDRAEVRRRNFIPPEAFPHDTGMPSARGGTVIYDSGNYPAYLETALQRIGYHTFGREQEDARRQGRYLGLGLAAFIESTGTGAETAHVRVCEDGRIEVLVGSPSNGQGHATTFAQMAAERLGVSLESIDVRSGDTAAVDQGTGTFASRMGQYGGNAVSLAARALRKRALHLASDLLEIAPADLEIEDGIVTVRGMPDRRLALSALARAAAERGQTLEATETFQPTPGNTWVGGVNAAIVEVDPETGSVTILHYLVVHDSGTVVNPMIVEGQIHGGVLHGIGNVLYEDFRYDEEGQPRTSTFMDYTLPATAEAPPLAMVHFETPSPFNPEGIKGAGEGGTIAAIPTLVSAIEDALSPFGVQLNNVPLGIEQIAVGHRP